MDTVQLLGSTMGLGFAAGLRLYATVLAAGLGLRFGLFHLPPGLEQHTAALTNPVVLTVAAVAYVAEFFADKIPWVDSVWDGFHTFVRPVGAALLGLAAFGPSDPALRLAVAVLCGGVAFTSHSSKAAARLALNHSPEPFTNIAVSLAEDILAPFGVWLSLKHPVLVFGLVLSFLFAFAWISPRVFRLVRLQAAALSSWLSKPEAPPQPVVLDAARLHPDAVEAIAAVARNSRPVPPRDARAVARGTAQPGPVSALRCAAAKSIGRLRNSIGHLTVAGDDLVFVAKRLFRYRVHRIALKDVLSAELKRGILLDRLVLRTTDGDSAFYIFKNTVGRASKQSRAAQD